MTSNGLDAHCCAMHRALALARLSIGGMGADRRDASASGPAPSFTDGTVHELSSFLAAEESSTHDLYEVVPPGRWLVVRGVTVLPMHADVALPAHDILIRDGTIRAVQPSGQSLPADAIVRDGVGAFAIPGLSDMHSHTALYSATRMWAPLLGGVSVDSITLPYDLQMFLYFASGITRMQVMAGTPEHLALRALVKSGKRRGPAMRIASPVVDGHPAVWAPDISYIVGDAEGGRTAARMLAEAGYDFAKPYTRLKRDAYLALAAECAARGIEMTGHIPKDVRVEEALHAGQRGVAHTFEYFYNDPEEARGDPDLHARRAKLSAQLGVTVQTTLLVARAFEYDTGHLQEDFHAEAFLDPMMRHLMNEQSPFIQSWRQDPYLVAQGRNNLRNCVSVLQAMHAEGVRLVTGTDIASPNGVGPHSLHHEFEMLVRDVGLTPYEVLHASTRAAAVHFGEAAHAGTIEPGKRADLVLLARDPRADIEATREIEAVIVGGALLSRAAIAIGMERVKAAYAAMPIPA